MRTAAAILVSLPVSFLGFVIGPTASARTPSEYKQEPWTTCEKATSEGAIAACTAIIDNKGTKTQDLAPAYTLRGRAYAFTRRTNSALKDFAEALRIDPRHVQAYDSRGHLWLALGDYDRALRGLQSGPGPAPGFHPVADGPHHGLLAAGRLRARHP